MEKMKNQYQKLNLKIQAIFKAQVYSTNEDKN